MAAPADLGDMGVIGIGQNTIQFYYDKDPVTRQHVVLGKGSFGVVYSARDANRARALAIKVVKIRHLGDCGQRHMKELLDEIPMHAELEHPNIIRYYGCAVDNNYFKIFMEQASGGTLLELVKDQGPLITKQSLLRHFTRQLVQGLAYLDSKDIIHRDIKGSNILFDKYQGLLKIADFGHSRKIAQFAEGRNPSSLVGTPPFMAPEVIQDDMEYTTKADIWSLGCTFVEMAKGRAPFTTLGEELGGFGLVQRRKHRKMIPAIPDDLCDEAKSFLQRCFVFDPNQRASAKELLDHPFVIREKSTDHAEGGSAKEDNLLSVENPSKAQNQDAEKESQGQEVTNGSQGQDTLDGPATAQVNSENTLTSSVVKQPGCETYMEPVQQKNLNTCTQCIFVPFTPLSETRSALNKQVNIRKDLKQVYTSGDINIDELLADPSAKALTAVPANVIVQGLLPDLYIKDRLETIIHISCVHHDNHIKLAALAYARHLLLKTQVERESSAKRLIAVEKLLRPLMLKDSSDTSDMHLELLEALYFFYSLLICYLYLCLLHGSVHYEHIKQIQADAAKLLELLDELHDGCYCRFHGMPYKRMKFEVMAKFVHKALRDRLSEQWPILQKDNRMTFRKFHYMTHKKLLKRLLDFCRESSHLEEVGKAEKDLLEDIASSRSWFEKVLFLQYLGVQCFHKDKKHLWSLLKQLVFYLVRSKVVGHSLWSAVSTISVYVEIINSSTDAALCESILNSGKHDCGLLDFYQLVASKDSNWGVMAAKLCFPLLYHDCVAVRKKIATNMLQIQADGTIPNKSLSSLVTSYQRSMLMSQFQGIRLQLGRSKEMKPDKTANEWRGHFEGSRCVMAKLSRLTAETANLSKRGKKKTSIQEELEVFLQLCEGGPHPNLPQLIAYQYQVEPLFFLVETLSHGSPLGGHLVHLEDQCHQVTLKELLSDLILPIIQVVAYCHQQGVILRDITADAFLVRQEGNRQHIQLHYPSLAKVLGTDGKKTYTGTKLEPVPLLWCAPESILTCEFSPASDCYMLGHTIFEVLTLGCFPYNELYGWDAERKAGEVLLHGIRPEKPACVPQALFKAISRCFAVLPANRSSANQLETAVRAVLNSQRQERLSLLEYNPPTRDREQPSTPDRCIPAGLRNIATMDDLRLAVEDDYGVNEAEIYDIDDPQVVSVKCEEHELHESDDPIIQEQRPSKIYLAPPPVMVDIPVTNLDGPHIDLLKKLDHANITPILKVLYRDDEMFLRSEVLSSQTLLEYALQAEPGRLDILELVSVFRQIASAMKYIHEEKLLHCNLQARFVYVTNERPLSVQVGHLGRSQMLTLGPYDLDLSEATVMLPCGSLNDSGYVKRCSRWHPREVNQTGSFSKRSDVASFGVLMWEVLTAVGKGSSTPHTHVAPYAHIPSSQILHYQARRRPLPQPAGCPDALYDLIKKCMLDPAHRRPLFAEIEDCLGCSDMADHPLLAHCRDIPSVPAPDSDESHVYEYEDAALFHMWRDGTISHRREILSQDRVMGFPRAMIEELEDRFRRGQMLRSINSAPSGFGSTQPPPPLPTRNPVQKTRGLPGLFSRLVRRKHRKYLVSESDYFGGVIRAPAPSEGTLLHVASSKSFLQRKAKHNRSQRSNRSDATYCDISDLEMSEFDSDSAHTSCTDVRIGQAADNYRNTGLEEQLYENCPTPTANNPCFVFPREGAGDASQADYVNRAVVPSTSRADENLYQQNVLGAGDANQVDCVYKEAEPSTSRGDENFYQQNVLEYKNFSEGQDFLSSTLNDAEQEEIPVYEDVDVSRNSEHLENGEEEMLARSEECQEDSDGYAVVDSGSSSLASFPSNTDKKNQ